MVTLVTLVTMFFLRLFFLGHRVTLVTWVTLWFFEKKIVSRSQGHVDHVIFFVGKFCFWVTGSRGYTKLGHVCDPEDYRTQIHTDTQNWVTYVTRNTKGHRDTKLGHVCDPGGFDNIDHNGTRVTGSRWSRGSHGFILGIFFGGVTGSRGSRCVFL